MKTPPKRHVRVFRIHSGRWAYLVTGAEPYLPFQGEARSFRTALRRGMWWLKTPRMRTPQPLGGTDCR